MSVFILLLIVRDQQIVQGSLHWQENAQKNKTVYRLLSASGSQESFGPEKGSRAYREESTLSQVDFDVRLGTQEAFSKL